MTTYRTPDKISLCASCGGGSLTPATKFDTSEGYPNLYFQTTKAERTLFGGNGKRSFAVNRARACLHCGHIMFFFSAQHLESLRAEIGSLAPDE
jgi:hypothetical protein